ncbi:Predicted small secreted protein [Pseudidiomarina planktonica]|uniref:Predicted small secreted protein n=1 Tax=Pseudidiomarina planktonica TaxID=1323738 RepID=A0A1Y6ETC4_9GAMM|nr:hypothetical protein [Pseudidiomarina planktonica]SMQ64200.1 Predicted small secreted protein [Pseudidiomarina planktonica]
MKKNLMTWLASLVVVFTFAGCQTIEGAGEDIEDADEAIQEGADNQEGSE